MSTRKMNTWHLNPQGTSTQQTVCCDIFTAALRPCSVLLLRHFDSILFTTATLQPYNVLLLWHFDPVTFYYCDTSTLSCFTTETFGPNMDGLFVHLKIAQMTVIFRPILILISLHFLPSKGLWARYCWHLKGLSHRFSDCRRTIARDFYI